MGVMRVCLQGADSVFGVTTEKSSGLPVGKLG